jgi:N6-adenosine-specific RNA methylase IME4
MQNSALIEINKLEQALDKVTTPAESKRIEEIAVASKAWAKERGDYESAVEYAMAYLYARRKTTELIVPHIRQGQYGRESNDDVTFISDYGFTKMQWSRRRQELEIPEEVLEDYRSDCIRKSTIPTVSGLLRIIRELNKENDPPPLPDGRYRVIYADPPWKYGNTMPDSTGVQDDHYELMTVEEICAMPVRDIAEDNAVLFLWATSPILEEAFDVVRAWGFEYKASFIWDKVKHVMGHYNSVRHELLLICTRGSCQPDVHKLFDSVVSIERTEHSEKPEYFREMIDTIYPLGKRIEFFARKKAYGWDIYSNEPIS